MKPNAALGTLWMITILSGSILLLPKAEAESPDTTKTSLSVEIEASCTLSSQETSPHTTSIIPGGVASDIGSTTINAVCNDPYGFDIYAVGYGNDTEGDTNMHSSTYTIPTGTTFSGNTSAWAMKIGTTGNPSSPYTPIIDYASDYSVVPSTATRVAHVATNTDASSESSITTTYKVYASPEQKVGTYIGKVKYNISHPYVPPVTALAMQDVADWGDDELPNEGDSVQAVDSRDGKSYWVTRLADGNIWMTQNLDYDIKATGNEVAKTDGTTTTWDANPTYATGDNTWEYSYDLAESYDPGNQYFVTSGSTSKDTIYPSLSECTTAGNSQEVCEHGHNGNYYNWYAATAGSNAENMNDGDEAPQSICPKGWRLPYSGYNQTGSKSWLYMLSNSIANYGSNAATSQAMRTDPFYIPRAGDYDGSVDSAGSVGGYWSSTANGYGSACQLLFYSSYVYPQYGNDAYYGYSVRCVATQ